MDRDKSFDVIAVYFTNVYWNDLVQHSKERASNTALNTVDAAYRLMISNYCRAFCIVDPSMSRDQNYLMVISSLRETYNEYSQKFFNITFTPTDFINKLAELIIPPDNFRSAKYRDKEVFVRKFLNTVVGRFTKRILEVHVENIVKERTGDAVVALRRVRETIRGEMIRFLGEELRTLEAAFLPGEPSASSGVAINVHTAVVEERDRLRKQNSELTREVVNLKSLMQTMKTQVNKLIDGLRAANLIDGEGNLRLQVPAPAPIPIQQQPSPVQVHRESPRHFQQSEKEEEKKSESGEGDDMSSAEILSADE